MIDLFAAGWGEGWWRVRGRSYVSDGERLWTPGRPAGVWQLPGVHQVVADRVGVRVLAGRDVRLGAGRPVPVNRADPVPGDGGVTSWVADGYVYCARGGRTRAVDVVGPGERAWIGGGGVVVVEGPAGLRVGRPGQTPRSLAEEAAGVRVADDGSAVAFVGPTGTVRQDLETGERSAGVGLPVSDRVVARDGGLWSGRLRLGAAVSEGTSALRGHLLAGPAGRVWDLAAGRPVTAPGTVLAGATTVAGDGFLTVDGETGRGHFVSPGGIRDGFTVPLDPEDVVTSALEADGALWLVTASGSGFRWERGAWSPAEPPPVRRVRPSVVTTELGPFPGAGQLHLAGVRWVWNDAGWLVRTSAER